MSEPETKAATKDDKLWKEYDHCAHLEQELAKIRWTFFTASLTLSLAVGGFALSYSQTLKPFLTKSAIVFGCLVFIAGYYHYRWFHGKAHDLRDHLCELEKKLQILVYRIRTRRPRFRGMRIYYHWVIDVIALAYIVMLILVLAR